ncbi:MAG TPA: prenyltransferase [Chthoniobacterales bacterium]|nr:prenyltransferase [Chthoniobacterales bacterium]
MPLALIGVACAVLYPAFLKKYALGDLLIVIAFGFGLTLGAYAVQFGEMSLRQWLLVAFLSLPICLLVDAILHANNLRDAADDRTAKVRTLATTLKPQPARALQFVLLFGPLVFVLLGVIAGVLPIWSLATFAALPLLLRAANTGTVEGTAQTHLVFGLLYTGSLLVGPLEAQVVQ